jgi:hypothetical protein
MIRGVDFMLPRWLVLAFFFIAPATLLAQDAKKDAGRKKEKKFDATPAFVPYRLTDTHHTLVRVKINGKGPFNFVIDTGCPVMLISEPVGKKLGLDKGWATLDKLELEGGLELTKLKARIETPFQIEGMNGMGLAGVELHGLMGYTVLAKYKMEFDFTKKQMIWTPVQKEPLPPQQLKGAKNATGGMDAIVTILRFLTAFAGIGPPPAPQPRGFFGFELEEADKMVRVSHVLADSPAAKAGLRKGDRIVQIDAKDVGSLSQVLERGSKITPGKTLDLTIERGKDKHELKITAGDGL